MWVLIGFLITQRLSELIWARRNTARLMSQGAKEFSPGHYPVIVALHTSWIAALMTAATLAPERALNPVFLAIFILLTVFRLWILVTLGSFFTTKIISLPTAPLRKTGPYRFVKHPNYLLVAFEIIVVPMIFGLWQIAIIWGIANLAVLAYRIREENLALAGRI